MTDQFYTIRNIAKQYYSELNDIIQLNDFELFLEPSAGSGSFYDLLPADKRIGIDIEPNHSDIIQMNFFDYVPDTSKRTIVIGNPPFGKVSSMAVKFFNRAADFADVIACIIPRTFKRVSIQNQLDRSFHLIHNSDLPMEPCCFEPKMGAKCSFQIWQRQQTPRELVVYDKTHPDFSFLKLGDKDDNGQPTPPVGADFAMKAYGANCGEIVTEGLEKLRPKSWHWIKSNIDIDLLKGRFKCLDYSISKDTVRQDSIGQKELIHLYKNSL